MSYSDDKDSGAVHGPICASYFNENISKQYISTDTGKLFEKDRQSSNLVGHEIQKSKIHINDNQPCFQE